MPTNHFDEPVAATYDDLSADMFAPEVLDPTVAVLAELAMPGCSALELAVGTGRVALPLAERGVRMHGVELSAAMLRRLRAKPGAEKVTATEGDMTSTRVEGRFALVYLVFNTIGNVTTQDGQVAVFANAAAHLEPGGHFVVEVGVPRLQSVPPGERFHVFARTEDYLGVDEYDVATQQMWSHHHRFTGNQGLRKSIPFRYVWPSELDLMARLAGMRLVHRWAGWDRSRFTADSTSHVSVWQREP
ncbi:MAG: Methyltransferase type 11 [Marmoricola sp.]|nr:Methyltransferase type 11 [Marmoricola sp.]